MTKASINKRKPRTQRQAQQQVAIRAAVALLLPPFIAALIALLLNIQLNRQAATQLSYAPIFTALAVVSWLLGLRWYHISGLGLRGRRPLFAAIGFAVLGWVALLLARLLPGLPSVSFNEIGQAVVASRLLVEVVAIATDNAGRIFFYLLLFEAFALQLWTFGLLFHALAHWRGPLTAAIGSGLVFGAAGFLLFREAFAGTPSSLFFFMLWGILYGIIRLRTGSLLGTALVQALQSFTVWYVFLPPDPPPAAGLQAVYLAAGILYAIIIWRLWPRDGGDYRV